MIRHKPHHKGFRKGAKTQSTPSTKWTKLNSDDCVDLPLGKSSQTRLTQLKKTAVRNSKTRKKPSKGEWWLLVGEVLQKLFAELGIFTCELGRDGCWKNDAIHFAHCDKRWKIPQGDLSKALDVIRACDPCHDQVEFDGRGRDATSHQRDYSQSPS